MRTPVKPPAEAVAPLSKPDAPKGTGIKKPGVPVKAPVESDTHHKVREEIEVDVEDAGASLHLLERLGFRTIWRYQKYRSTFTLPGLEATVDETPIGCFVELEGDPRAIDRTAADLGFPADRYVTATYRELAEEHASRSGRDVEQILVCRPAAEDDRA